MDIDTPDGMAAAINWAQRLINSLRDGGARAIPALADDLHLPQGRKARDPGCARRHCSRSCARRDGLGGDR